MGDSFLRNVYAVYNFGEFINGTNAPSIQLLSVCLFINEALVNKELTLMTSFVLQTTNATQAYADFNMLSAQRNQSLSSSLGSGNSSGLSTSSASKLSQTSGLGTIGALLVAVILSAF